MRETDVGSPPASPAPQKSSGANPVDDFSSWVDEHLQAVRWTLHLSVLGLAGALAYRARQAYRTAIWTTPEQVLAAAQRGATTGRFLVRRHTGATNTTAGLPDAPAFVCYHRPWPWLPRTGRPGVPPFRLAPWLLKDVEPSQLARWVNHHVHLDLSTVSLEGPLGATALQEETGQGVSVADVEKRSANGAVTSSDASPLTARLVGRIKARTSLFSRSRDVTLELLGQGAARLDYDQVAARTDVAEQKRQDTQSSGLPLVSESELARYMEAEAGARMRQLGVWEAPDADGAFTFRERRRRWVEALQNWFQRARS